MGDVEDTDFFWSIRKILTLIMGFFVFPYWVFSYEDVLRGCLLANQTAPTDWELFFTKLGIGMGIAVFVALIVSYTKWSKLISAFMIFYVTSLLFLFLFNSRLEHCF